MIPASLIPLPTDPAVAARVERIVLPWNRHGSDPYGVDKKELAKLYTLLSLPEQKIGLLELRFTPGVSAYAFTFG